MPVWGFVSDVHGNLSALERAVARCRASGAERFAFLGDLLGRGSSDACVALIRALADVSVVGNRDLDWQDRVGPETRAYVLGLPTVQRADDFLATHGDARLDRDLNTDDVRRGFRRTYPRLLRDGARLGFFGHSHRARAWRLSGPEAPPKLLHDGALDAGPATIALVGDPSCRWVVNVGTTGLPFPGNGPPSCAIYDRSAGTLLLLPI
jgi:predicted phosphodiesterase